MIIRIDQTSAEPLYLQLRTQIVEAIAKGELTAGDSLPSVRSLANDLGINLHTVNKAYAVLRDEGYVNMKGRAGAFIATPFESDDQGKGAAEFAKLDEDIHALAVAYKAHGGTKKGFMERVSQQVDGVFGGEE